jgi:maltooligosyltrehalose trehalohydrolase
VELQPDGRAHARAWAPTHRTVEISLEAEATWQPLAPDRDGYFAGLLEGATVGARYWLRVDGGPPRPDPVSRFQPDGPHGPSAIVDPSAFGWTDGGWAGVSPAGQVLYEMHVGTFTPEGTWRAAARELEALARLGITIVEMMPIAEFAGRFGWGYDGVNLYAPTRLYGTPDDLRAFIDRAHAVGIGVILDVVYNHLGPDGNYLGDFSGDYFTDKYKNDWGRAINFEGPRPARDYFVENAVYWIDEFHFDGLRLDATQDLKDASPEHVMAELTRRARAAATRPIYVVAENEPQDTRIVRSPDRGGHGLDALWNDDFHHTAVVTLTGRREAYYHDYKGSSQELISCAKYGYLYQGQWYAWQKKRRGSPGLDLPGSAFIGYIENHDQVANSAFGRRLHQLSSPGRYRTITALLLLGPATPMLFQGQEFASSAPFLYFADHGPELRGPVMAGRREFLQQFANVSDPDVLNALPSPVAEATFERCRLDLSERERHVESMALHADLLALRRSDPVIARAGRHRVDGATIAPEAFVLRYFGGDDGDRLLVVNLGCDLELAQAPEPLLAPPAGACWRLQWSSESVRYGGNGTAPLHSDAEWHIPGETAVLLIPDECPAEDADNDDAR